MGEGTEANLNFDSANLANATSETVRQADALKDYLLPLGTIAIFCLLIYLSLRLYKKLLQSSESKSWSLRELPLTLRVALLPLLTAYLLTHVFSAATVFYNTKVATPSTFLYFQAMGTGRLLSLTHAHLFAHATMYFIVAALVQFSGAGFLFTVLAPLLAMWAGVFDVFAWWGIKEVSPNFEWLAMLCGSLFSAAFLLMSFAILRSALCSDGCKTKN